MTEDDGTTGGADALLYDWFKHLTSLCLLSLGGVLALAEKGGSKPGVVVFVLAMLGLAAVVSFSGAAGIVQGRVRPEARPRYTNVSCIAAPALLSIGVGGFLYLFVQGLFA